MLGKTAKQWAGPSIFFVSILILLAGCDAAEKARTEAVLAEADASQGEMIEGLYEPPKQDALSVTHSPTPAASPPATRTPVVRPSATTRFLHLCAVRGERVHETGTPEAFFICALGPDEKLRWLDDVEASRAAAMARTEAWVLEHGAKDAARDVGTESGYTGKRCYAPGGRTYTNC